MSQTASSHATPRVAAILVVSDGETWLPSVLRSLKGQDCPNFDLVVVDNGSKDGSAEILRSEVAPDRLITFTRGVGFGRAVVRAARHEAVADADYLFFAHDDLSLLPDTVRTLVDALEADPSVAIAGPKLREWSTQHILQEAGMTIDRFGRAANRVERGELDQGQMDGRRDVLYVSTAGMLVRTDVFADLGGFDPRFTALRDDLDLCWRAWLTGHRVEVVPEAIGYHAAAGSRGARRLWRERSWQGRFLSERHALATLLKNYGARRLAWVLPLTLLLGLLKLVGFAMTRRFADLGATVRAYLWNVVELPATLRARRAVQRSRLRSDAELDRLFETGLPRMRAYVDEMRSWLAGSDTPAMLVEADDSAPDPQSNRIVRVVRERPAVAAGVLLGFLYLLGTVPLLGPGQLIGGTILPWPDEPSAFFRTYASPLSSAPFATDVAASPIHALFGALGIVTFGNEWLAQRLLLLGLLPVAWLTALRAGRLVTARRGPRVVGAALYVLSPVVLGTMAQGRVGELIGAALLPALILLTARAANPRSARKQAWRAAAWLAFTAAVMIAASPGMWLVVVPVLVAGLALSFLPTANAVARPLLRMMTAVFGTVGLLAPWLFDLVRSGSVLLPEAPAAQLPAWRALALAPLTLPGMDATLGTIAAAATVSIVVLALMLGLRLRPLPVTALCGLLVGGSLLAWGATRLGVAVVWTPALLLPAAAALAGLGVVAARTLGPALRRYTFGIPQVTVVVLMVPLAGWLLAGAWTVAAGPWDAVDRGVELVPPYVTAEEDRVGPYRVLIVDEREDALAWSVNEASGPSMRSFAAASSRALTSEVGGALESVMAGDLDSGRRLGLANVRYVVLADEAPELTARLLGQPDLEPMVAGAGRVFRVASWVPRVAVLPSDVVGTLLAGGPLDDPDTLEGSAVERVGTHTYREPVTDGSHTVLVSGEPGTWDVRAAGVAQRATERTSLLPIPTFEIADASEVRFLDVEPSGRGGRVARLILEGVVLLGLVSLLLRPPGFVERAASRVDRMAASLPFSPTGAEEPPLEARLESVDAAGERDA